MSWINKSSMTNLIALIISVIGILIGDEHVKAIGFYALSGAITNWIAIFMLFEKIPFLYGSGIIPNRFEEFKRAIKNLIMRQFFSEKNIEKFFSNQMAKGSIVMADKIIDFVDYDKLFDGFVDAIMESQFGGMVSSFLGGKEALAPMKDSFIVKIKKVFQSMLTNEQIQAKLQQIAPNFSANGISEKVEKMVDSRLDELTPQMVKEIIQEMIRNHLGWLVIWGGVFGGLIGLVLSFFN